MTVTYNYLGYGVTDENGIAKLEYDSEGDPLTHSYTGTGAGKVDIVASLDDSSHISDSSLQSETYELWDYIRYDYGTQSDHNDIWYNYQNHFNVERKADYTQLTEIATQGNLLVRCPPINTKIEFDVYQEDGTKTDFFFGVYNPSNMSYLGGYSLAYVNSDINLWTHVIMEFSSTYGTYTVKKEGQTTPSTRTITGDAIDEVYLGFWGSGAITKLKFKNFKVYPI